MKYKAIMEKLYLEKSGNQEKDIFVESPTLPQHHINALRFIYCQYKKKNPGIILNDPEGYGKTVEVVLFINAMKHLLKQPVLIVCNDDEVDIWLDNFRKFTNISEEVSVNPSNPFVKGKKVLIATWGEFVSFYVRSWSMLVIHNDEPKKELFKYNFNAEFKIWVTSTDMMEDLDSFITIYEWLHPKDDISLIQHNGTALERAIHLDAFMKDVVIRSTGYQAPGFKKMNIDPDIEKNKRKVKNKDITGKKIKRSKKTVNESEIDALIEPIVKEESCHPKDGPSTIKNIKSGHNSNRLVENSGMIKHINKLGQRNESKNVNNENVHLNEIIKVENAESIETVDVSENILNNNDVIKVNGDIDDDDNSQNIRLEYTETNSVRNEMDVDESPSILYINSTKRLASMDFNDEVSDKQSEVLVDIDNANSFNDTDVKIVDNEMACKCSSDIFDSSSQDVNSNDKSKTTEKLTEFDYEMEEMENKALKKFKGSLLDKLF